LLAQSSATTPVNRDDRSYWLAVAQRIATPVLTSLSRRELKKTMPVEARNPADRAKYAHLEAFGRLLAGIAPWLVARGLDQSEIGLRQNFSHLAQASLDAATDPGSPDFMNFHDGSQPLVDAAFLAQGILRAPSVLWEPLEARVRRQIVEAMKSSRAIPTPTSNNWVMFAAMVEALLKMRGEKTIEDRFEGCVHRMLSWYKGDGVYGERTFSLRLLQQFRHSSHAAGCSISIKAKGQQVRTALCKGVAALSTICGGSGAIDCAGRHIPITRAFNHV
jgi:hypothetical protein